MGHSRAATGSVADNRLYQCRYQVDHGIGVISVSVMIDPSEPDQRIGKAEESRQEGEEHEADQRKAGHEK
jgi:hypothetical protein